MDWVESDFEAPSLRGGPLLTAMELWSVIALCIAWYNCPMEDCERVLQSGHRLVHM